VKAIVYMEAIVRPFESWDEWPDAMRAFFQAQRTPAGEDLILLSELAAHLQARDFPTPPLPGIGVTRAWRRGASTARRATCHDKVAADT
jgi:hypothetical protein